MSRNYHVLMRGATMDIGPTLECVESHVRQDADPLVGEEITNPIEKLIVALRRSQKAFNGLVRSLAGDNNHTYQRALCLYMEHELGELLK